MAVVPGPLFTQPKTKLVFNGPFDDQNANNYTFKILNQNSEAVAFSVSARCQQGDLLHVSPPTGVLAPGQGIDLAVLRSWRAGPVSLPAEGVDKLIVEWVYTPDGADTFSRSYFSSGHCMVRKKTIDIGYNE